jgi:DNA-3-methyladenine glycosylase I
MTDFRCPWAESSPEYVSYHDDEWGRPVGEENRIFEKLCLEGFQSGLSWITILRKREAFRTAFCQFDPEVIASYGDAEIEALLEDAAIVRHRGKITATIENARALLDIQASGSSLAAIVWKYEPRQRRAPKVMSDIPSSTDESKALSKELKKLGLRFVGPTTVYAAMQSLGVVNDHLAKCICRAECETDRKDFTRPEP